MLSTSGAVLRTVQMSVQMWAGVSVEVGVCVSHVVPSQKKDMVHGQWSTSFPTLA